jgi:hypothetical protein
LHFHDDPLLKRGNFTGFLSLEKTAKLGGGMFNRIKAALWWLMEWTVVLFCAAIIIIFGKRIDRNEARYMAKHDFPCHKPALIPENLSEDQRRP